MPSGRKWIRRGLRLVFALAAGLALWHAGVRWTAPARAVRVVELAGAAAPPESPPAGGGVLRVGAWNIAHGRGPHADGSNWSHPTRVEAEAHLERIAALLRAQDLDLVVLNEVDFDGAWSHGVNQARFIARAAGYPHVVEQRNLDLALPFFTLRFGNAILSRFPLRAPRFVKFPPRSRGEDWVAGNHDGVVCEAQLPGGPLRVLAVHLESRDEATRAAAARVILALADESPQPLLALGDFNSAPPPAPHAQRSPAGENAMEILFRSGRFSFYQDPAAPAPQLTFPSGAPDRLLDWILVTKPHATASPRVLESDLSDHRPVTAEILPSQPASPAK